MSFVAWFGAVFGGGGFVLGVYNAIRARGSERRKRQGELRAELRDLITPLRDELIAWDHQIKKGASGYMGSGFLSRGNLVKLRELAPRIVKPAPSSITALPDRIEEISRASSHLRKAWHPIPHDEKRTPEQRNATRSTNADIAAGEAAAQSAIDAAIATCHELIDALNKVDRGWRY